jgi:NADPH:quinone reductase-like Zn-dependent oxidoreductase
MQAIIQKSYGSPDVLNLAEVEKPIPRENEIRIRVRASSVSAADIMMRRGSPFFGRLFIGLFKPNKPIPGTTFSGEVEYVGKNVRKYSVGDRIFGETALTMSAHAEYVCLPEMAILAKIPAGMSYEQAAPLCDGAMTSLNFLTNVAELKPDQRILINGASGGLGTAAVQLAKLLGAHVTGVCSTANVQLVKDLGADEVIDYTSQDFTQSTATYDVIFDTVGKSSFTACKKVLTPNGTYVSPVLGLSLLCDMLRTVKSSGKKAKFEATGLQPESKLHALIKRLQEIVETGTLDIVIDQTYPLARIAAAQLSTMQPMVGYSAIMRTTFPRLWPVST